MLKEYIENARNYYSTEWAESSVNYEELGFYDWCINSISKKKHILEVGCGVGYSTKKIIENGHRVITIEENPYMLNQTEKLLSDSKIEFQSIRRENLSITETSYKINYKDLPSSIDFNKNILIEGDILTDYKLQNWLITNLKLDTIVC